MLVVKLHLSICSLTLLTYLLSLLLFEIDFSLIIKVASTRRLASNSTRSYNIWLYIVASTSDFSTWVSFSTRAVLVFICLFLFLVFLFLLRNWLVYILNKIIKLFLVNLLVSHNTGIFLRGVKSRVNLRFFTGSFPRPRLKNLMLVAMVAGYTSTHALAFESLNLVLFK